MIKYFRSIKQRDPAARHFLQILLVYPGVHIMIFYRIARIFYILKLKLIAQIIMYIGRMITKIEIHPGARIGKRLFIDHGAGVVIGETAVIGNDVRLYQGVTIGALNSAKIKKQAKRHPTIEDNVIIYSGATILGNITVGRDSVIGGNSWITFSVPANSLVYNKSEVDDKDSFSHKDSVNKILKTSKSEK